MKLFFLLLFLPFGVSSQDKSPMLLLDPNVQIECTEAVNDMYNFKFERAEKQFDIIKLRYPDHPLPYFLKGLSTWWKMMPNLSKKDYDDIFLAYMDSTITMAEKLYKKSDNKIEAAFFLSGAYGFKAQFHGERDNYARATWAGKNALKYLSEYKDDNDLSPEFLYGVGLYNYYEVWIKEEYPLLRPVLFFFKNGDKQEGIRQLEEVANNAFYARTEAQYQLVRIYASLEERKDHLALPLAQYLHQTYPDNPYFERLYARAAFYSGSYELESVSRSILKKIEEGNPGYEEISGRYASYFLGYINKSRNPALAKEYFLKTVYFAEKIGANDSGYYLRALKFLAEFAEKEGNKELAKQYYQKIKNVAPDNDDEYREIKREAKKNLKRLG
jgi:hypothetical protein